MLDVDDGTEMTELLSEVAGALLDTDKVDIGALPGA